MDSFHKAKHDLLSSKKQAFSKITGINGSSLDVTAYCKGHFNGPQEECDLSKEFADAIPHLTIPGVMSFNKFYQTMNLFGPEDAKINFRQNGFEVDSFYLDMRTGKKVQSDTTTSQMTTVILMEKLTDDIPSQRNLSTISQFFEVPIEKKLLRQIQETTQKKERNSLSDALEKKDYSLMLRRACAYGNLKVVKLLLKHKSQLYIDISATFSNGKAALDWLNSSTASSEIKNNITNLLNEDSAPESRCEI